MNDLRAARFLCVPDLGHGRKGKVVHHDLVARAAEVKGAGQAADGLRHRSGDGDFLLTCSDHVGEEVAHLLQLIYPQLPGRTQLFPIVEILLVGLAYIQGKGALGAAVEKDLGLQDGKALAVLHGRSFLGLFGFT